MELSVLNREVLQKLRVVVLQIISLAVQVTKPIDRSLIFDWIRSLGKIFSLPLLDDFLQEISGSSWEQQGKAKASEDMQQRQRGLKVRLKENVKRFKLKGKIERAGRGREVIRIKEMLGASTNLK